MAHKRKTAEPALARAAKAPLTAAKPQKQLVGRAIGGPHQRLVETKPFQGWEQRVAGRIAYSSQLRETLKQKLGLHNNYTGQHQNPTAEHPRIPTASSCSRLQVPAPAMGELETFEYRR